MQIIPETIGAKELVGMGYDTSQSIKGCTNSIPVETATTEYCDGRPIFDVPTIVTMDKNIVTMEK